MKKFIAGLMLMAAMGASQASSGLINVQFAGTETLLDGVMQPGINPPQTGAVLVGSTGDYWNSFAAASLSGQSLLDSNGGASGAQLSFTSEGAYTSQPDVTAFTGQPAANLMGGYLWDWTIGTAIHVTVNGLTAGKAYDLYVYTQGDFGSYGRSISLSVNGGAAQTSIQTNASSFILNDNYLYFRVLADTNGVIDIAETGMAGEGNLNGFQLLAAPVPEPSSVLMLLAGLGLLTATLRQKRKFSGN